MMEYIYKYKKINSWIWKKEKVVGHKLIVDLDKLELYYKDGSVQQIPEYSKLLVKLGQDWVVSVEKSMKKESGLDIKAEID